MSILLADIDATCAALGYSDGQHYQAEPDAVQGLKHLIWILRRDLDNHEYRRHLGHAKVLQTDLVYMLPDYIHDEEFADVLIRLLVILTNPTLLLYRDGPPKDNHGRKVFLELIDILQGYKSAFIREQIWTALFGKMQKSLEIDWALRSEEQSLLIERILVLIRNVLQVPANSEAECRADNDASVHDQVIWALHQSGILDLVLFIVSSPDENQFHLHGLEILCLLYREQTAESLADASLQRSVAEKQRDEQELIAVRRREKQRLLSKPPPGRHSRFGGTYVIRNFKSVSDRDIICHQPLERVAAIDFDREKQQQKRSFRHIKEEAQVTRRSAFSVRLCLREYCIEVLRSAYNTLIRQVRRVLERNSGSSNHDDSYLLWAIRFFMEFNRLSGLQLQLVSESLSVQCFHWVLTRMQHDMDMIVSDKGQARLWAKRLHIAIQTFRELLHSMLALQKLQDENALALFDMLLNNVCYVLEYRETILHLLMNYNEAHSTKAFLRDVIETANIFIKMMEKFCKDTVVVQDKKRGKKRSAGSKKATAEKQVTEEERREELENKWAEYAGTLSSLLSNELELPEEDQPIPFDVTAEKSIDDQKDDCMKRINKFLREEELEKAVALLRAAREVWPENDIFGAITAAPEDELLLLREIFLHNITAANLQCGQSSKLKRTIIHNPTQLAMDDCLYVIEPYSSNVCQLLVEFESFELQQPLLVDSTLECMDYLEIGDYLLCGSNSQQHLYLPFNVASGIRNIPINFQIPSRWSQSNWRLVVTQLECPAVKKRINLSFLPFVTDNSLQDARTVFSTHNSDWVQLAPPGCNQYFRQSSGTIKSFNYNENIATLYMPNLNYVICIKPTPGATMIEYTVRKFSLGIENSGASGFDTDCHSVVSTTGRLEDYLMIPQSVYPFMGVNTRPTYYCGTAIKERSVVTVETTNEAAAGSDDESENEEYEESENNMMVEKTFKFEDFAKRLLNPKIVRACTIVLTEWDHIPAKPLKAAVTILHRIAYGCSCPAMLYQAKLFLIFQQVFNAPRDVHHEELRRLGVYVIKKFVETAPNNPKIYAELLFYKTIKEANELETGYCDVYDSGTKGAWSEEQENELRLLFEENQRNPATDKDVIDWILENLIDKKRTRRGVLKKLKELGLMFKAPTKKSSAAVAGGKNLWQPEEDEELRSLYDMHRLEKDCLQKIMQEFFERRSKQQIIKRMLQLHIIADKSEIMPSKPRKHKSKKAHPNENDSNQSEDEFMEEPQFGEFSGQNSNHSVVVSRNKPKKVTKPKKSQKSVNRKIIHTALDVGTIRSLLNQIDSEKFQEAIDWLKEALEEAAEDEEAPAEEDDGVPLLPLTAIQKEAMEDADFKKLLISLSIQPPIMGIENYWRIPIYLNAADLKIRARILGGEELEIDADGIGEEEDDNDYDEEVGSEDDTEVEKAVSSKVNNTDDEEDALDNFARQRKHLDALVFTKSDEEAENREPLIMKGKQKKKEKKVKKKKLKELNSEDDEAEVNAIKRKLDKKKRKPDLSSDESDNDDNSIGEKELIDKKITQPPNNADTLFEQLKNQRAKKKNSNEKQKLEKFSEASNDVDNDLLNFNSEDYRKRLLELGDSDDEEQIESEPIRINENKENTTNKSTNRIRRINIIDSESDEEEVSMIGGENETITAIDNNVDLMMGKFKSVKDDYNVVDDNNDDVDKTNNQFKHRDEQQACNKRQNSTNMAVNDNADNKNGDEEGAIQVAASDGDAVFIKRKKSMAQLDDDNDDDDDNLDHEHASKNKSIKRRRLAIVDDDDDNDNANDIVVSRLIKLCCRTGNNLI